MSKNWDRHAQFKALGKAISRQRNGPTMFNPWYKPAVLPAQDKALTSMLGNRYARLHRSSKGPRLNTLQWEPTGRRG